MRMLRTLETKATLRALKKFGNKISISNNSLRGTLTIKNYRKYKFLHEVDIIFEGEIYVNLNRKRDWYDSSIMNKPLPLGARISKVKVNRFIRKNMLFEVKTYCKYFDVDLSSYDLIKKIIWK